MEALQLEIDLLTYLLVCFLEDQRVSSQSQSECLSLELCVLAASQDPIGYKSCTFLIGLVNALSQTKQDVCVSWLSVH